jgi:hypothetical protein
MKAGVPCLPARAETRYLVQMSAVDVTWTPAQPEIRVSLTRTIASTGDPAATLIATSQQRI